MYSTKIRTLIGQQWAGLIALFLVIAGGTALAAALPKNSVTSKTVKDNALKSKDLKNGRGVKGVDVNASQVQLRVGESCPAGQAIRVVNVDGGVLCEVDDQGGGGPPSGPAGGDLTGTYPNPAIADGAVNSAKVADNSLGGDDIAEPTLGQVPSALLGGFGRFTNNPDDCDPNSLTLIPCATVTLSLPAPSRVLVIGHVMGFSFEAGDRATGTCELGSSAVDLPQTTTNVGVVDPNWDNVTVAGITPPVGPGTVTFRINCNEASADIRYNRRSITAVALSPN